MKVTNKVIKMQSPEWAAEARYLAAETAESISADLMYISLTEKPGNLQKLKYRERAKRLKTYARNLYSQNILNEKKFPNLKHSEWVKKSHIKISGLRKSNIHSLNKMFQLDLDYSKY